VIEVTGPPGEPKYWESRVKGEKNISIEPEALE
jgi:hypothetical protein